MEHTINRDAVDRILHGFIQVSAQGQYSLAEVAIAAAEFAGRMIVSSCDTPISGINMAQVYEEHLKRTLTAGYSAKGFNMGEVIV
jgi:hypothetical protein